MVSKAPSTTPLKQHAPKPETVESFLESLEHPFKPEILALRQVILSANPGIAESIKWNAPSFSTSEHFATFQLRAQAGVQVILHLGAKKRDASAALAIADPQSLLDWLGTDRASVTFRDLNDIKARRSAFEDVIRQWIRHIKQPSGKVVKQGATMIDTPQITEVTAQPTALIHITIPRSQIREAMGPGYSELMDTLATVGVTPSGPWYTHHLRMDPEIFDFELGVPIAAPFSATGRVQPGELPAATVAQTIYHGSYEGLPDGWGEFDQWIAAEGHTTAPDLWERYLVGPESDPDPAAWRTELNRPLER